MEIRRRNVTSNVREAISAPKFIENLDVFPKLPNECKKSTSTGGLVTLITVCFVFTLTIAEVRNYYNPAVEYSYEVDSSINDTVQVNVDMTVATRCSLISLDVVDTTGSSLLTDESVSYTPVLFEQTSSSKLAFENFQQLTRSLESKHYVLHNTLWKQQSFLQSMQHFDTMENLNKPQEENQADACHIIGKLFIKKVAGNIHVMYGKSLGGFGNAHIHIAPYLSDSAYNFSHRIYHFSFGDRKHNQIDPLQAVEAVTDDALMAFQYYVTMVPTHVVYPFYSVRTYQYTATIQNRSINHAKGSHGIPGIFFNYDTFPLVVRIVQNRELLGTFLARLAVTIGGLFSTVGLIRQAIYGLPDVIGQSQLGRCLVKYKRALLIRIGKLLPNSLFMAWIDTSLMEPILNPDSDT